MHKMVLPFRAETIRAITFDVGGTLIEPQPSVGHIYAEIAAAHGVTGIPPELLNERFAEVWRVLEHFNYSREEWAQLVDKTFAGLTSTIPSRTFFPALYAYFAQPEAWRIFADVFPTLEKLAANRIKLGIISNWDERLAPLLGRLKLCDLFEVVVVSCDVGFCKPSNVIFEQAAQKLNLPPSVILHVGDNADTDVRGARASGFKALQLCRKALEPSAGKINSLADLP